ncbi:vitamin K epoxide reductase family protein [Cellulomonas sp. 179-A 4D5 NHS]|uniref:vitamin K epoxide reductase family protein n=1 Tax=Cellulomonas sp. 179-A 4D5 NHS TaxID=3142378 RepID=UPI0039A0016A
MSAPPTATVGAVDGTSTPTLAAGLPTRAIGWVLAVGGAIGFLAAFVLTVEKITLLGNPSYIPTCSINPVLSCGSVMSTPQAELFGFPNPLLGIAGFAMVLTAGMAVLSGARPGRWFWLALQLGTTAGAIFVHWLIFQSLYRIGALCPYCMVVWAVTIPVFWYTTLHNLQAGHLPVAGRARRPVEVASQYHAVVLTGWALSVLALIGAEFWLFWTTLL